MSAVHYLRDTLINFVTGLGTWKDPSRTSNYALTLLDRNQLENAYRSDWIARRIVDAPAEDATREWRDWQASNNQIEALEAAEKKHKLQLKLKTAMIRARLYGGAALVIGVDDGNQNDEPLNLDGVEKDSLKFVVVMNRYELSAGPRIYNVDSEWYTRPKYYTVQTPLTGFSFESDENKTSNVVPMSKPGPLESDRTSMMVPYGGTVNIHPSRVIEFTGNELPDWRLAPMGGGWGDSVLQTADDTLREWGLTIGGIAAMVNDAKMDVIKIKDFSKNIATKEYADRLLTRFAMANQSKSAINSILLDTEEEWSRVTTSFSGLPNLMSELMTVVAGAGGLPVSRLFGKAGSKGLGKSSSGQDELRNYYDGVTSEQKTEITPRLEPLDQVLIRSALGKPDNNIHYSWAPLYLPEPKEEADIAKTKAEAFQIDVNTGMINEDALRKARINQLIEDGVYPGLEDAIDEFGEEPDLIEARTWSPGYDPVTGKPLAAGGGAKPGIPQPPKMISQDGGRFIDDAAPRTLYVRRDALNGAVIVAWAKAQGFSTTVPADDMHVTIAFSRQLVDWMKVPETHDNRDGNLVIPASGVRMVEALGTAVVLMFNSSALAHRHEQIRQEAGASWDWPEYQPHVTITFDAGDFNWRGVEPYRGEIVLGPEVFEEVKEDWKSTISEDAASDDEPRDDHGKWTSGGSGPTAKETKSYMRRATSTGYLKRAGHLAELEKARVAGRRIRAYGPAPTKDALDSEIITLIRDYNPDQPRGPHGQWETSHESYKGHDIFTVTNKAIGLRQYHVAKGGKHMGISHTSVEARAKVDEYVRHVKDAGSDDEPRDEHGRWTSGSTLAGKIKLSTKDPASMSNAEIAKEYEKVSLHSSAATEEFIKAGRGMEKPTEWMQKTDELSLKQKALWEREAALQSEHAYRSKMGGRRVEDPVTGRVRFVGKVPASLTRGYYSGK